MDEDFRLMLANHACTFAFVAIHGIAMLASKLILVFAAPSAVLKLLVLATLYTQVAQIQGQIPIAANLRKTSA
jgi:hypothetical protein